MLRLAYKHANELIDAGSGFRFIVTMNSGKAFNVIPLESDNLKRPMEHVVFWECCDGDVTIVIRHSEIASIEVVEA